MYQIGDFSRLVQIPVKTLRYYDIIGVLRPDRVEHSTGYRYYAAAQVEQLNRVLVFTDLGFSLREILALHAETVPRNEIRQVLRFKRAQLERRVLSETARLARITAQLDHLDRGILPSLHEVAVRRVAPRLVARPHSPGPTADHPGFRGDLRRHAAARDRIAPRRRRLASRPWRWGPSARCAADAPDG